MFITVEISESRPLYQQVADGIKALIAKGDLKEGTALPPVRQVAADLGVNLNTVATAYRRLQEEGLITVRHGSGAVVSSRKAAAKNEDELRKPLRTALTQFILAGLPRSEIISIVSDELRSITKGAK